MKYKTEIVDEYLTEVGVYVRDPNRADILRELRSAIADELDAQAEQLGRPPTADETAAVLDRFGEPSTIAARFAAKPRSFTVGRPLIGPELFPLYLTFLRWSFSITAAVFAVVMIRQIAAGHDAQTVAQRVFGFPGVFLPMVVQLVGTTLAFVVWERLVAPRRKRWTARRFASLPPPRRAIAAAGATFALLAIGWLLLPDAVDRIPGRVVRLTDGWRAFHLPVFALLFAASAYRIALLRWPLLWRYVPAIRFAISVGALGALAVVRLGYPLAVAQATASPRAQFIVMILNAPTVLWWLWLYFAICAFGYGMSLKKTQDSDL